MATVNLIPNANISNDWGYSTGSSAFALLDENHTGRISTDLYYIESNTVFDKCVVGFTDFTEDHSAINSVQAVLRVGTNNRGASARYGAEIQDSSGTLWSMENSGLIAASINYTTETKTARTTSNGSDAWTQSILNDIRMEIELTYYNGGGNAKVTYAYFIVDYDPLVATGNSIFFGTNF
tara:strand:+ start:432 stop:971 length:540 start_codon:yes stop_codon:yes gene_type:complete